MEKKQYELCLEILRRFNRAGSLKIALGVARPHPIDLPANFLIKKSLDK